MKVLLIVGGVLFLLLAFLLFAAAVVMFFVARSRRAKAAGQPQPQQPVAPMPQTAAPMSRPASPESQPPPPPLPTAPPPPPAPAPAPTPAPFDADGTVVLDSRRNQTFGALHGTAGALTGRILPIDESGFYIGRDKTVSQVVIENPSVSKRHVWIGVRDGNVMAIDQQSTNGTYLKGQTGRIGEVRLSPGDILVISDDVASLEYRA